MPHVARVPLSPKPPVSDIGAPMTISGSSARTIGGIATAAAAPVRTCNPCLRVMVMVTSSALCMRILTWCAVLPRKPLQQRRDRLIFLRPDGAKLALDPFGQHFAIVHVEPVVAKLHGRIRIGELGELHRRQHLADFLWIAACRL